jgi:hypothetical protein
MKLLILVPLLCTLASLILSILLLFAGQSPNFMEDTHIIMLNTSMLGKDLVPTPTSGSDNPTSTDSGCGVGGVLGKICGSANSAAASALSKIEGELDGIADDIADKLADKLGIKEFYSLHVLDVCEGDFTPNATTPGAGYNVTNCTKPLKTAEYNITKMFDHELEVGPFNLNLADLGFTSELQEEFDKIPRILLALAVVYILAVGFTGLACLASVAGILMLPVHGKSRAVVLANLGIAALGFLTLLAGSLVTTIGAKPAADKINDFGNDIGLAATVGGRFLGLTWAAVGLMVLVVGYWFWELRETKKYGARQRLRDKYEISGPQYVTRY